MSDVSKKIAALFIERKIADKMFNLTFDKIEVIGDDQDFVLIYHEDADGITQDGFIGFLDVSLRVTKNLIRDDLKSVSGWYYHGHPFIHEISNIFHENTK
jgi:hypothetical protein